MARKVRIQYPGAIYHVMNRGDHREFIFSDEPDRLPLYIETQSGKWHYGAELRESGQAKAERLIEEVLHSEGVSAHHLVSWRKGHPFKIKPSPIPSPARESFTG